MKLFKDWPRFVAVAFPPRHIVIAVNTADLPDPLLFPRVRITLVVTGSRGQFLTMKGNLLSDDEVDKWT